MGDFEKEMEALAAWPRHRPGTRLGLPGGTGFPYPAPSRPGQRLESNPAGKKNTLINIKLNLDKPLPSWYA